MATMKLRLVFLLLLALGLCSVCSDDATTPVNDNPPDDNSKFSLYSSGDEDSRVDEFINAANGGTIEVSTDDSVRFILSVPAYSLPYSVSLLLTPLDSFDVAGPVVTACVDTGGGTGFCFPGIICEPTGTVFDSGAILTVEFPESQPFTFDSGITIAYFDTEDTNFYACSTVVDTSNRRLSCIIHHFSGYTTTTMPPQDEEDECAALEAAYFTAEGNARVLAGTESFYYSVSRLLELRRANWRSDPNFTGQGWIPCPSFNSQVDAALAELISLHWTRLQATWGEYPVQDLSFSNMIDHHKAMRWLTAMASGYDAYSTAHQTADAIHLYISNKARELATYGYNLCQEDNCDGRDYLADVIDLGAEGYVVTAGLVKDDAYLAQVTDWYNDCCNTDITVTVGAPVSDQIYRLAYDVNDVYANPYHYLCSLTVTVTGSSGTPKEGIPVQLWREGQSYKLATATSDEDGKVGFTISPDRVDWACQKFETWNLYAKAYVVEEEEWVQSDNSTSVTFHNTLVTTTISYQYEYSWQAGDAHLFAHASLNGSGTSPGHEIWTCLGSCEGKLTRDYSYDNCYHEMGDSLLHCVTAGTIGGDSAGACRAIVDIESVTLDNGMTVDFLFGARISLGESIFAGLIYAKSTGFIDTLQYGLEMSIWPENAFVWTFPYGTGAPTADTTWSYQSPDTEDATQTANLRVTIAVE